MWTSFQFSRLWFSLLIVVVALLGASLSSPDLRGQTTISTGSIQGTISDPTGAVVPNATVTISSKETGQSISLKSSNSGAYSSGALLPGEYTVRVESKGFKTTSLIVTVQVGVTAPGNMQLELGHETIVITIVPAGPVNIDTEQSTVQGVLTAKQIEQLPINGRNFLDVAALEPGIQIQDGVSFDPTKQGFSSISFGGRFGRTARIELDGIDISDETVGTTTQNIPLGAIQEFSVSQSSLDLSTELTSSGAVNVVTRSGSNSFHGESFVLDRDAKTSARYGQNSVPFDRQQYGVRLGGALIRNRLFFFADWERTVQDFTQSVTMSAPFTAMNTTYNGPYHESMLVGRLDWLIKPNWRAFYRWTYNQNNNVAPFVANVSFEPFANRNNTPVQAAGLDGTMGSWSHAFRFGFTHFKNAIVDTPNRVTPSGIPADVDIDIGPGIGCGEFYCSGPNILAPQSTLQHNLQFKYDGSKIYGSHILRYGVGINRIQGGLFASFFGLGPDFRSSFTKSNEAYAASGPFAGGASNPLNWPIEQMRLGNGQGYFTEIAQLGLPAGGEFDTRFAWYIGDGWKVKPNLTVNYGLRYVRDTGRSDADLPGLTLLNQWGEGLGNRVNQPNLNFAPQLGIAWDPGRNGKTAIRAGAGLYYENAIFNNVIFDRPGRLTKGLFWGYTDPCPSGHLTLPDGTFVDTSSICTSRIGNAIDQAMTLYNTYQDAVARAGAAVNPGYLGETMANGGNSTGGHFLSPDYRTPRSWQFNVGVQRELTPGTVLTVDYVRNVATHYLLNYDTNHVGDAHYLDGTAAMAAIHATNASYGCPDGSVGIDCTIAAGASIRDYVGNGLDSGKRAGGGPNTGYAFPGINPHLGENEMLFPIGRSVYNGLQTSLRSNKANPAPGIKNMSLVVSYALSRFKTQVQDQDFVNAAPSFTNTSRFFGPSALDRTHQFSLGGSFNFPYAFQLSYSARFATATPLTLQLPGGTDPGTIFFSDWYGDGSNQDHILPGTNIGSFGRDVKVSDLNNVISSYNTNVAGTLTPAGKALVGAGLFTQNQLAQLGGVMETVSTAPDGEVGNAPPLNTSICLGWILRPHLKWISMPETLTLEPTISIFNLFNFSNWNSLSGELNGGALSVNGTTRANRTNKVYLGSGIYAIGAPRTFEWGVKVTF